MAASARASVQSCWAARESVPAMSSICASCRLRRARSSDCSYLRTRRLWREFAGNPRAGGMTPPATPVMRQYREAKEQHPDGILLFRLGDFYEIFFEDAEVAAPIMGVTLTSRPLGKTGRAPMCGVPHHAWQSYVGKLLRAGHKVVICDQVEAAEKGKKIVKREVTRVLTPGTVV